MTNRNPFVEIIVGKKFARVVPPFLPVNLKETVEFRAINGDVWLEFPEANPFDLNKVSKRGGPSGKHFLVPVKEGESADLTIRDDADPDIYPYRAYSERTGWYALAGSDAEIMLRGGSGGG